MFQLEKKELNNKGIEFQNAWHMMKNNPDLKLASRRQDESSLEDELEFCSECFFRSTRNLECTFCFNKYMFKASKRVKPSSKYWYSRAGK